MQGGGPCVARSRKWQSEQESAARLHELCAFGGRHGKAVLNVVWRTKEHCGRNENQAWFVNTSEKKRMACLHMLGAAMLRVVHGESEGHTSVRMQETRSIPDRECNHRACVCVWRQILGYINPWMMLKGPGATCTVAREVLDVLMGLLLMSNRISQANRCVSGHFRPFECAHVVVL